MRTTEFSVFIRYFYELLNEIDF